MKNLKKVLALVLVVATLCGFAAGVGATDFTDAASVKNSEAVEVMNALGVINGYTDGSFKPAGNVTRAEMAKMVSFIMNGGEDVGSLYSAANVFTDCGYHWARGYIAYASNVKLVAGVGGNKFNPDGNVTGVEAAKMLLCALGYDADAAGYVGTTWASKVLADAKSAGLLKGFARNFDYSLPLNRDNAALMMLNAIKADMVEYEDKGSNIIIGGFEVVTGAKAPKAVVDENHDSKNNIGAADNGKIQLGEDCFPGNKGLKFVAETPDSFGRPSHVWTYDGDEIGTYSNDADVTYTEEVKLGDIYTDIGKIKDADAIRIVDGAEQASVNVASGISTKVGGQGTLTEVYVDDDDNVTIVEINTYVAKIANTYAAKLDKNGDVTTEAYINLSVANQIAPANLALKYETDAFTKDDKDAVVLYTAAKEDGKSSYTIQSVTVPETVEGVMSRYTDSSVTVDGTKYNVSAKATNKNAGGDFDGTFTYYLDTYGNVIDVVVLEAGSTRDYAYVVSVQAKETNDLYDDSKSVRAKVIFTDGKTATVDLRTYKNNGETVYDLPADDGTVTRTVLAEKAQTDVKTWFSYSVNSSDAYTFRSLANNSYATVVKATASDFMTENKAPINGTNANGLYLNSRTVVTSVDDDGKVTTFTGLPKDDVKFDNDSKILVTHASGSKVATAIYAVDQSKGLVSEDVTYAYAVEKNGNLSGGDQEWTFAIDGAQQSYTVESGVSVEAGKVYTLTLAEDTVTEATAVTLTYTGVTAAADEDDSVIVIKSGASDLTITKAKDYATYDVSDDAATAGQASTISEGNIVNVVVNEDGEAAVAYITAYEAAE